MRVALLGRGTESKAGAGGMLQQPTPLLQAWLHLPSSTSAHAIVLGRDDYGRPTQPLFYTGTMILKG